MSQTIKPKIVTRGLTSLMKNDGIPPITPKQINPYKMPANQILNRGNFPKSITKIIPKIPPKIA